MGERHPVRGLNDDSLLRQFKKGLRLKKKALQGEGSVEIDLKSAEWITPAFLAPTCILYHQLKERGREVDIIYPRKPGVSAYLHQIGFPEGSEDPSEKYDNHLPLCLMNPDQGPDTIDIIGSKLHDLLKKQLKETPWGGMLNGVTYPISEIIDNVDYHSSCDFGATLVQRYPNKDCLDICIVDDGISIPGRYRQFGIDFDSDEEAVTKALQESISTRENADTDQGFGLRTTADMICDGLNGRVLLASRRAGLRRIRGNSARPITMPTLWSGTMFAARLNLPQDVDEFNFLDHIY